MDEATMNPMELVNEFYETHADLIRRSGDLLSDDAKQVEETFNRFQETSQTMVKGLTALGRLHPFVGGKRVSFLRWRGIGTRAEH